MTTAFPVPPELAGHPFFQYRNNVLYAEDVPLDHLAGKLGTPLYVYSRAALRAAWNTYHSAIGQRPVQICYGMKANSNLAVLKEFVRLGAGFDIVSGGELKRALAVGANPARIVFSGVGKQAWEMLKAVAADDVPITERYGMVISDIEMPEMDGYTLTRAIKADPQLKRLYVCLHTSLSGSFNQSMAQSVGADKLVPKFEADDLAEVVRAQLGELHPAD